MTGQKVFFAGYGYVYFSDFFSSVKPMEGSESLK